MCTVNPEIEAPASTSTVVSDGQSDLISGPAYISMSTPHYGKLTAAHGLIDSAKKFIIYLLMLNI